MMTQQYSVLRYSTYFTILVFHILVLYSLYYYSTKSKQYHVVQEQLCQQQNGEDRPELLNITQPEVQEAIVSFQDDSLDQPSFAKDHEHQEEIHQLPLFQVPQSLLQEETSATSIEPKTMAQEDVNPATKEQLNVEPNLLQESSINEYQEELSHLAITKEKTLQAHSSLQEADQIKQSAAKQQDNLPAPKLYSASPTTQPIEKRPTISPTAFFQAFKDSYYHEQITFGNPPSISSQLGSSNAHNSESELVVNQRLGELKIADYIQQIKKAFQEAARRTPGMYVTSGKELKTDLDVKLEIQSQGTVKIAKFQSSGISEIDHYIKNFLLDIAVNPIPKRYKVNSLPFSTKILINIDKDTRFYTIRCFF